MSTFEQKHANIYHANILAWSVSIALLLYSPHTSAYVRILPHTSAYVRIRQYTSEYVSASLSCSGSRRWQCSFLAVGLIRIIRQPHRLISVVLRHELSRRARTVTERAAHHFSPASGEKRTIFFRLTRSPPALSRCTNAEKASALH
jgi:hypothetical protein